MLDKRRRLVKNKDFRRVYCSGKKVSGKILKLYYLKKKNSNNIRFGFSISKKIGKAVKRNLLKRRLREICRKYKNLFNSGLDIIIVARKDAAECEFYELEKEVLKLSRSGKILAGEESCGDR